MALIYAGVLYVSALFIMGFCIYSIARSKHIPIEKPIRRLMFFSSLSVLSNATAVVVSSERIACISYGLYNIFIDLMMISMLVCIRSYTGLTNEIKFEKQVSFGFLVFDSLLMLMNVFYKWVFVCDKYSSSKAGTFYRISELKSFYAVHCLLIYGLALISFAVLGMKIYTSPKIYKWKYLSVFLSMLVVILVHSAYIRFDFLLDYSLTFHIVVAFIIFYFSVYYVPRGLLERLLFFTVANMKDGIICIDMDGQCVHANKPARMYADAEIEEKNLEIQIGKWFSEKIKDSNTDMKWDSERRIDGIARHYTIEYRKIYDNHMKYLGCFFLLNDRTEEFYRVEAEKRRATHDSLTGIYNKDYFYEKSSEMIRTNPQKQYLIICSDVKNFKIVNDMFGVEEGDRILKRIAQITEEFKEFDCIYGRISGDRFGVCMLKQDFNREKVLARYAKASDFVRQSAYKVHIHIGVYEVDDPSIRISVMCDRANLAIKTIKESYQNVLAYYDNTLRDNFINEQKVISEFENALQTGQFQPFIQPQISTSGDVNGGEALVRWIHPKDGMIPPYKFIEIFEKTGLISRLDRYMWEQACIKLNEWHDSGFKNSYISVNISQKDFYFLDVYETMTSLVKKYNINPRYLHLEITETAIMNNPAEQLPLIDKFRKFGFIIEIDDFGSGYSSLNTLKDLHADVLKIDMGFLKKTQYQERSKIILQMIIALAKSLNMEVITEGVETKEQVEFLARFGCDVYQGYYFAKPMPVSQFESDFLGQKLKI